MKKLAFFMLSALPIVAFANPNGHQLPSFMTPEAQIDLKGTITPKCAASTHGQQDLKLSVLGKRGPQKVTALAVYCNVREGAKISFDSANDGYLQGDADPADKIQYTATWNDMDILDETEKRDMSDWGHGKNFLFAPLVKVTPRVTGLEYAGTYTDTITVKVFPN
ncbi:hypothetical protein [Vibrio comitans]|uniref:Spore coat protein U domain-containing protein n=1 Tax=Vibrio comitans NBRC 102076 TaxID=1219078 RepID=A0A4Y3IL15_9VIBR|nr:hypothetical protein [Vibrio comitans]GEA60037.1 hypothetical protein VCO01S_12300 [Vibrio comitans NBRC 102076]